MLCRVWQRQGQVGGRSNMDGKCQVMDVLQSYSLRNLIEQVNSINSANYPDTSKMILKENIVDIFKVEDMYVLIYYKDFVK